MKLSFLLIGASALKIKQLDDSTVFSMLMSDDQAAPEESEKLELQDTEIDELYKSFDSEKFLNR